MKSMPGAQPLAFFLLKKAAKSCIFDLKILLFLSKRDSIIDSKN